MKCNKCQITMVEGKALKEIFSGTPEWPDSTVCTISPSGRSDMVAVWKCPQCGHSITKGKAAAPGTKELAAKMLALVEHFDADDEANAVVGEREVQIDLTHAAERLIKYEIALKNIRRHTQISMKGKYELSTTWMMANVALTDEAME